MFRSIAKAAPSNAMYEQQYDSLGHAIPRRTASVQPTSVLGRSAIQHHTGSTVSSNATISHRDRASSMARARTALQAIGGNVQTQQKDHANKHEQAYTQYFRRYELMIEFINLRNPNHCPRGIYVMPSSDNIDIWYGAIFIHKGYYADAVFKFRISVPELYPIAAPAVHFLSDIYHPLVDADRKLSLTPRFPDWRPKRDYIFHVLQYISAIFRRRTLDSLNEHICPNKEAIHLYKHDPHVFIKLAQQCSSLSVQDNVVYDNFPENNCIRFTRMSDKKFEEIKKHVFESQHVDETSGDIDMEKVLADFKSLSVNISKLTEK